MINKDQTRSSWFTVSSLSSPKKQTTIVRYRSDAWQPRAYFNKAWLMEQTAWKNRDYKLIRLHAGVKDKNNGETLLEVSMYFFPLPKERFHVLYSRTAPARRISFSRDDSISYQTPTPNSSPAQHLLSSLTNFLVSYLPFGNIEPWLYHSLCLTKCYGPTRWIVRRYVYYPSE